MLLTEAIHKTKSFFQKNLENLKSFFCGRYQKLPKATPQYPFSSSSSNQKMHQLDNFYREFTEQWESDRHEAMKRKKKSKTPAKEKMREESASNRKFINYTQQKVEKNKQEEKRTESQHEGLKRDPNFQRVNEEGNVLAQKMKDLEMMDLHDVDHVLDIEEVLHHYSCLTSPVYIDLVNTFFSDMYSEFSLPQPSASVDNSMRGLSPVKL